MDEKNLPEEEQKTYIPRPAWQVWSARIGVIVVIIAFLLYCYMIATGGV